MKIKVTDKLTSYTGKDLLDQNNEVVTIRMAILEALNVFLQGEDITPDIKLNCYRITDKVFKNKEIDFTVKELAFIRQRAEKTLPPITLGRLLEIIDPSSMASEDK